MGRGGEGILLRNSFRGLVTPVSLSDTAINNSYSYSQHELYSLMLKCDVM